jgi:hypothetical protein
MAARTQETLMRILLVAASIGVCGAAAFGQQAGDAGQHCRDLAHLTLSHTTILKADVTEAGKLAPPNDSKEPIYGRLPAFCRVVAESRPSDDSKIAIEVWLPMEGWNGRFLGVGNGGFAGQVDYDHMAVALLRGYATAGTDTGHTGSGIDATWALGHPEKIADFGYRGVHEMSLTGQAVAQQFFGRAAGHRYFVACSDGGREALMEAQRFPGDYDGILAGAPAYAWTGLLSDFLFIVQALQRDPASYIPAGKLAAISKAVLAQCGADAVGEFLDDPRQCRFDPATMLCKDADTADCLTGPQVTALKAIYAGPHLKDSKVVSHGWMPGAELGRNGWGGWVTGPAPSMSAVSAFASGYLTNMVLNTKDYDILKLDVEQAYRQAVQRTGKMLDALNPDLRAFHSKGGKLILYHGWNDAAIPAEDTIDYFNSVEAKVGKEQTGEFARLFLVSGMQHCAAGPGATSFGQGGPLEDPGPDDAAHSAYRALEGWVENGVAPEKVIASRFEEPDEKPPAVFTRPLCAYPLEAEYSGTGDRTSADSYTCKAPK